MRLLIVLCAVVAVFGCKKEKAGGTESAGTSGNGASAAAPSAVAPVENGSDSKKNPEGCNSDFAEMPTAEYTLTAKCSPYSVKHEMSFDGFNLLIEPGVEVRFADGAQWTIGYSARAKLLAKGTAEKPIRFTALDHKEAGSWNGITLGESSQGSVLENAVIEFAGEANGDAFDIKAGDVTVKNVKLSGAKGEGIKVVTAAPIAEFSGVDLTGEPAAHVLQLPWTSAKALGAGNTFPSGAVIELEPTQIEAEMTLPNPGVPYRTHGETDVHGKDGKTAVLTIEAGVTIQMSEDAQLAFGYEGDRPAGLKALGTAEKPIRFVRFGDDQKTTPWNVIGFYESARGPELSYVTFENGGRQDDGMLRFDNSRALGKFSHCTFSGSHGAGILVKSAKEGFASFDGNSFKDNAQAAIELPADLLGGVGAGNTFAADGWVEVKGDVHHDTTWAAFGAPIRVLGDVSVQGAEAGKAASLTIAPGVKLVFGEGAGLNVGYDNPGHLTIGGADKPIALSALQGTWKGIQAYEKGDLKIENATIDGVADDQPAIRADKGSDGAVKNVSFKSKLGLRNCSEKVKSSGNKGAKDSKDGC